mmetsp:Transcript_24363/g.68879  ORF Transcript_24363/g.68879 Transcript_24363/m.68879 type:complete len:212 (+) Transcript_24363:674-1309(+)
MGCSLRHTVLIAASPCRGCWMGLISEILSLRALICSFACPSLAFFFAWSAPHAASSASTASSLLLTCSSTSLRSALVSWPSSTIAFMHSVKCATLLAIRSRSTLSMSRCSSGDRVSMRVSFISAASSLVTSSLSMAAQRRFSIHAGSLALLISLNVLRFEATHSHSAVSGPALAPSTSAPSPASPAPAPPALAPLILGKTCTNFSFLPVSC